MNPSKARLLILVITLFRGTSYLFGFLGLESLPQFNLLFLRFGIAFLATLPLLIRRPRPTKKETGYSLILGFLMFAIFACIFQGIRAGSTSQASFLVSLSLLFVPVIERVIFGVRFSGTTVAALLVAVLGIVSMTYLGGGGIGPGDLFCILAAFLYAVHLLVTKKALADCDARALGVLQQGFSAGFCLICSLMTETIALPSSPVAWVSVLGLALLCGAFGITLQPVAQKHVSTTQAGLIFALEPVFASILGVLVLKEALGPAGYLGMALILAGVILAGFSTRESAYSRT